MFLAPYMLYRIRELKIHYLLEMMSSYMEALLKNE